MGATTAEGNIGGRVGAGNVKAQWVWEDLGIEVRRGVVHDDLLSCSDRRAAQLTVARRCAAEVQDRRRVPHDFLRRPGEQGPIAPN